MKKIFKERILFSLSLLFLVSSFVVIHMGRLHVLPHITASSIETWIPPGEQAAVSGQVADRKEMSDYQILYLKNSSLTYQKRSIKNPEIILYDNSKMEVLIGNSIEAKGEISYFDEERNPGNFDRKFYYKKQKIAGSMWAAEIRIVNKRENHLKEKLMEFREAWKAFLMEAAGEEKGGILCAMLLGDKTGMESEIKELYQRNGIAHVLAISGVKTLKLDIPLVPETRINWAFVPLHIAIIYILKLCLNEEIIPRCRFPCSRGYRKKYINWQKKQ